MTNVEVFPSQRRKEPHAIAAWMLAAALIALCIWASHWQYQRGVTRHARNAVISSHISLPVIALSTVTANLNATEWRRVEATGHFDSENQILLRNKYFEGKYGFELLTRFVTQGSGSFWVDRGWVSPGVTAKEQPVLPATSKDGLMITGRLRLDRSLPQGSFFAIPNSNGNLIEKWNAQSQSTFKSENFYLDLISTSQRAMNPAAPVLLPELTDGPHMAYALQWLFFGSLVLYARLLLRRSR